MTDSTTPRYSTSTLTVLTSKEGGSCLIPPATITQFILKQVIWIVSCSSGEGEKGYLL